MNSPKSDNSYSIAEVQLGKRAVFNGSFSVLRNSEFRERPIKVNDETFIPIVAAGISEISLDQRGQRLEFRQALQRCILETYAVPAVASKRMSMK